MRRVFLKQNFWFGVLVGIIFTAFFIVLKIDIFHTTAYQGPYALLLPAVIIASLYGGFWAGCITLMVSALFGTYFFATPLYSFFTQSATDRVGVFLYIIRSVVVISVIQFLILQERRLHRAREEEIHAKRIAESRLRDIEVSESRFRALVDSNIVGVMFWEEDGTIFDANQACLDMLGFSENELINEKIHWQTITPDDKRENDGKNLALLQQDGKTPIFEKDCIRKNGKRFRVLMAAAALESDGKRAVAMVLPLDQVQKYI